MEDLSVLQKISHNLGTLLSGLHSEGNISYLGFGKGLKEGHIAEFNTSTFRFERILKV